MADMPDLSHLTPEERAIIENVMQRQKQEEESEKELMKWVNWHCCDALYSLKNFLFRGGWGELCEWCCENQLSRNFLLAFNIIHEMRASRFCSVNSSIKTPFYRFFSFPLLLEFNKSPRSVSRQFSFHSDFCYRDLLCTFAIIMHFMLGSLFISLG